MMCNCGNYDVENYRLSGKAKTMDSDCSEYGSCSSGYKSRPVDYQ